MDPNAFENVVNRFQKTMDATTSAMEELGLSHRRLGEPVGPTPEEVRELDKKRRMRKLTNQRRRQNTRQRIKNRK